jgi:hypothetical protein
LYCLYLSVCPFSFCHCIVYTCPFVLFLTLYCLYFNVWFLITPLVSSNGDQYRSTGRKPSTCAS